jgi:23S rRNA (cytidine1920-2'-O)/16S rRNA (cytidine1409-2'-O)-methyltransferase
MPKPRRRLDRELVDRGLASGEHEAQQLIAEQRILVDGAPVLQPSSMVAGSSSVRVLDPPRSFVTRGGVKLAGALDDFAMDPQGLRCLDAGAGAGGFTDCLLQRGAAEVVAVDVGYGDFDWSLRNDPRVRLLERVNLRTVDPALLGPPFDLVVADLSFISLVAVLDRLVPATAAGGDLLLMVKPQFEAPRDDVGAGGIVDDAAVWAAAVQRVADALWDRGLGTAGVVPSRLRGAEGNQEFFVRGRFDSPPPDPALLAFTRRLEGRLGGTMP